MSDEVVMRLYGYTVMKFWVEGEINIHMNAVPLSRGVRGVY